MNNLNFKSQEYTFYFGQINDNKAYQVQFAAANYAGAESRVMSYLNRINKAKKLNLTLLSELEIPARNNFQVISKDEFTSGYLKSSVEKPKLLDNELGVKLNIY